MNMLVCLVHSPFNIAAIRTQIGKTAYSIGTYLQELSINNIIFTKKLQFLHYATASDLNSLQYHAQIHVI